MIVAGTSYVHSLSSRVQAGAEFVAFVSARNIGGSSLTWQAGCNVGPGGAASLDVGVLGGWLDASPRIGLQIGMSIDLNRPAPSP